MTADFIARRAMQLTEDAGIVASEHACGICGHDPACGHAQINDIWYCHADDHSCYIDWQERLELRSQEAAEWESIFAQCRQANIESLGKEHGEDLGG